MRNNTRGQYWVGYGRLPYSVQDKNVNISIYTIPDKAGLLEPHIVKYTHAYFPVGLFDEVNLDHIDDGYVFGRKGDTYIMLHAISNGDATLSFKNDMNGISADDIAYDLSKIKESVKDIIEASGDLRYDLIFEGGSAHAWITQLGSIDENGSFEAFVSSSLANNTQFADMTVTYTSADRSFDVKYDEYFKINGEKIDTNYARFENTYVEGGRTERGADQIKLSFNGKSLTLNFNEGTREE
jgi:hypothetical protein